MKRERNTFLVYMYTTRESCDVQSCANVPFFSLFRSCMNRGC